jgi:hypothetical protein
VKKGKVQGKKRRGEEDDSDIQDSDWDIEKHLYMYIT